MEAKVMERYPDPVEPEYPPLLHGLVIVIKFISGVFYTFLWRSFMVGMIERVVEESTKADVAMKVKKEEEEGADPEAPKEDPDKKDDDKEAEKKKDKKEKHKSFFSSSSSSSSSSSKSPSSPSSSEKEERKKGSAQTMEEEDGEILGFPKDCGPRHGVKILSFERAMHIRALNHPHIAFERAGDEWVCTSDGFHNTKITDCAPGK